MYTTIERWVTPKFSTMFTNITIRERINLELEATRGYRNVYPAAAVAAEQQPDNIEEFIQLFTINKARQLNLTRELQLCSEELAEDADIIAQ